MIPSKKNIVLKIILLTHVLNYCTQIPLYDTQGRPCGLGPSIQAMTEPHYNQHSS